MQSRTRGLRRTVVDAGAILLSIVIVYAVMALNKVVGLWPHFGLDYSTHTAIALVFVVYFLFKGKALAVFALISMLMYAALMVYQGYHSVLDISSTAVVVAPLLFLITKLTVSGER